VYTKDGESSVELKMKNIFISFGLLLFSSAALASNDAGAFLRTGAGARALAMGGSQAASGIDAVSGYWNPAKLGLIKGMAIDTMLGDKFGLDLEYASVGFANEITSSGNNLGALNIVVIRQGIEDIPKSTRLDVNNRPIIEGSFDNVDQAIYLSYGYALTKIFSAGTSLKYISQQIDGHKGSGYGFDAGFLAKSPNLPLTFGLNGQNIGQIDIEWKSGHTDTVSTNIKAGIEGIIPIRKIWMEDITIEVSSDKRKNRDIYFSEGFELCLQRYLCVRLGHSRKNLSAGGGIRVEMFRLDYSFTMHDLGDTHWFGLGLTW